MHFKTILSGAFLLAAATLASATDFIYIVGSNGDRSATQAGILNVLQASGNWSFRGDKGSAQHVGSTDTTVANATNSNYGAWKGTFGNNPVVIRVSFIGAAGAVGALATPQTARFVVSDGTYAAGTITDPYSTGAVLNTDYTNHLADFGFSTNYQKTTPFSGGSYDVLSFTRVGVSPIVFVASPGFPGTGLTSQAAQALYSIGSIPVSLITGSSADQTKYVYALGRNTDAGQRFAVYGEIGAGTGATVQVWQPATPTGQLTDATTSFKYGGTIASHALWPIETVSGVNSGSRGNGGFKTGGDLSPFLTVPAFTGNPAKGRDTGSATPNYEPHGGATAGYYIGYITVGDYNTRVAPFASAVLLSWNGVPYTAGAVRQGRYTAWVYNNLLRPSTGIASAPADSFATSLEAEILNTTATANGGLRINDPANPFDVERILDGGPVTPLFE